MTLELLSSRASHDTDGAAASAVSDDPVSLGRVLSAADDEWSFRSVPEFSSLVNWSATRDAPIHRWIRYREAYSAELIDALDLQGSILDPFCGCGSILVGAASRGMRSTGIDLNPIATFVSRVKTNPLTLKQLESIERFRNQIPSNLPQKVEYWIPSLSIAEKVFEPNIWAALLRLRAAISEVGLDEPSRAFLKLAWIAILEKVGSYFKEGNGIKYRNVQRQRGKYVARPDGDWQLKRFGQDQEAFVFEVFSKHLKLMVEDAATWGHHWASPSVVDGNAMELSTLTGEKFNSIIFSPPYANRFDYFESMKVELWFGEFVQSYDDVRTLRKSSLRSHLGADLKRPQVRFDLLERLIDLMDQSASSWRMGVPELLRGYFSDIVNVLSQCREKLDGGACHVVVGNSAFGGVIIPSDTLTAVAGSAAGFKNVEILEARHLTVSPQQRQQLSGFEHFMRESIVVMSDK